MTVGVAKVLEPPGIVGEVRWETVSGVGFSSSRGKGVGRTVGTRVWKATGVINMGSVGSGVSSCGVVQPIAVSNRIEEKAKHPALNLFKQHHGRGGSFGLINSSLLSVWPPCLCLLLRSFRQFLRC